jgi:hypothetical protein
MADAHTQSMIMQPPNESISDPVRVFAMPARYRHGAVVNMVEPQKVAVTPGTVVQPPAPPKTLPPIPVAAQMNQPTHTKKGLLIAGFIVLVALMIGGYLFFRSVQKNNEAVILEQPIVTETPKETPDVTQTTPPITTPPSTEISTNPFPPAATPGVDTDSDGLTDGEETIVYSTNPNLPDSDSDGFLDGNEVYHGYNPNGTAPGTLVLAGLAQMLQVDGFQLLYPAKWVSAPLEVGIGSVITTNTGENMTVQVVAKDASLTLVDWYQQNVTDGTPSASKSKKGYPMLVAKNQLSSYIDLGSQVVTLIYDTSTKATIDYLQTVQMMVNSVEKL